MSDKPHSDKPHILIAIPKREKIADETWRAARTIELTCMAAGVVTQFYDQAGTPRDHNRNTMVHNFLTRTKADYIFWIDSDTVPPPDAGMALLGLGVPVATGITPIYFQTGETMCMNVSESPPTLGEQVGWPAMVGYARTEPYVVKSCGASCMLIRRDVFTDMGAPWYVEHYPSYDGVGGNTEDMHFCRRLVEMGVQIVAHPGVYCGHIKTIDLRKWIPLSMVNSFQDESGQSFSNPAYLDRSKASG